MTYITPDDVAIRQDYLRSINHGKLPNWARVIQPDPALPSPTGSPLAERWRDPRGPGAAGGSITSLTGLDTSAPSTVAIALTLAVGFLVWYRSRS